MKSGHPRSKEVALQAAKWGADRLASSRRATEFINQNGFHRNYLQKIRKHTDPPLSGLMAMATFLDMSLDEFLEEAWAHRDETDDEDEDCLAPPKNRPNVVEVALAHLSDSNPQHGDADISDELRRVDDLRYKNPVEALAVLEAGIAELALGQIPYALNLASSCFRMTQDFKESSLCGSLGYQLAERFENRLGMGDNRQRWVYLLCNVGRHGSALRRNAESRELFTEANKPEKLAETLVDRGYCLYRLGEHKESIKAYLAAGKLDSLLKLRHRINWRQAAGDLWALIGDIDQAREYSSSAIALAKDAEPLLYFQSIWVLGRIEGVARNLEKASTLILEASNQLKKDYPAVSLIARLELSAIALELGESVFASEFLSDLGKVDNRLLAIPQISEAVQNVLALVRLRRLTVDAIKRCISKVHAARVRLYRTRAA